VILTGNYGEAGAIDRFGPALGLPSAYSGHNAFWDWGPPSDRSAPVITVGIGHPERQGQLRGCRTVTRIRNRLGVDNAEQGRAVFLCRGPRGSWAQEWPAFERLG
jgi:hypothetical protein